MRRMERQEVGIERDCAECNYVRGVKNKHNGRDKCKDTSLYDPYDLRLYGCLQDVVM